MSNPPKTSLIRAHFYVNCGFSAPRVAELLDVPLEDVKAIKGMDCLWEFGPTGWKKRRPRWQIKAERQRALAAAAASEGVGD